MTAGREPLVKRAVRRGCEYWRVYPDPAGAAPKFLIVHTPAAVARLVDHLRLHGMPGGKGTDHG